MNTHENKTEGVVIRDAIRLAEIANRQGELHGQLMRTHNGEETYDGKATLERIMNEVLPNMSDENRNALRRIFMTSVRREEHEEQRRQDLRRMGGLT